MQTGTQIGKYFIGKKLGAGGMADVYLATDSTMGRDVALKVLPPEFARDPERVHRFQKEVQASAALSHPNIIPVYDVGEAQVEGLIYHFYTMALLPGGDLKQRIEQGLSPEQSLAIIKAIADALGYAHDKGLVHRDIKPENILFDESDRPILTDLGIAKAINTGTKMTGTGMSIGTPHYMSPEQAKGESDLDGRSDIYALGIMLFEMLTGQVPYKGDNTMAVGIMHIQNPLPELPQHLNQYQGLLDNCLAKDKANRYQHTQQLIGDIDKLGQGQAVKSSQKTRVVQGINNPIQSSAHQGVKWGIGGALAATLLVVAVYYYQQAGSPKRHVHPPSQQAQIPSANQANTQSIQLVAPQKSEADFAKLSIDDQIEELVIAAESDISALRLSKPDGNNALEKIYKINKLKPNNEFTIPLTEKVTEKYKSLILDSIETNQFNKASQFIGIVDRITPNYSSINGLTSLLVERKRATENPLTNEINSKVYVKSFLGAEQYVGKMVTVPRGEFVMGCSLNDAECFASEKPRRMVSISSFTIMESEVTFAMWNQCVKSGACLKKPTEEPWSDDMPVVNINYDDIVNEYIPWLRQKTNLSFRLPSEAEWEYAARANTSTKYYWGTEPSSDFGNGYEPEGWPDDGYDIQIAPVKSYEPNAFGLYDMLGNLSELTSDCWNPNYFNVPNSGVPILTGECEKRVVRGGDWISSPRGMRVSHRNREAKSVGSTVVGFRLVLDREKSDLKKEVIRAALGEDSNYIFSINLGTFRQIKSVDLLINKLRSQGYVAYSEQIKTNSGSLRKIIAIVSVNENSIGSVIERLNDMTGLSGKVKSKYPNQYSPKLISDIHELHSRNTKNLPSLNFSAHMYSNNTEERWVRLNGIKSYEGDEIGRVKIIMIQEDYTILQFQEIFFSIDALTDWR